MLSTTPPPPSMSLCYLNGRKPPMIQCANADRYQGVLGISLAMFFVRQGASNGVEKFLPKIPPITVKG